MQLPLYPQQGRNVPEMGQKKTKEIVGRILFASLVLSVAFSAVRMIQAPQTASEGMEHIKVKAIICSCSYNACWV